MKNTSEQDSDISSDDMEVYRKAYRWRKEQEQKDNENDQSRSSVHLIRPCGPSFSLLTPVVWHRRNDNVLVPVPSAEPPTNHGAHIPVVPHAWYLREDGVYAPFPENPFCEPRIQTEQVWIDPSGAKRPNGALNE